MKNEEPDRKAGGSMPNTSAKLHNPCQNCQGEHCIKEIPLLSSLSRAELEKLTEEVMIRDYKKGDRIFRRGDKADGLFIVCSGKMKITKSLSDGKEQILYIYSPGDFIGAFNLLKADRFEFDATAIEPTQMSILKKGSFDAIILKNPEMTLKVLEKAYDRINSIESLVERLSIGNSDAKVASMLLSLVKEFGKETSEGILLDLTMNREEMASLAGIARETVIRKMKEFQREDILEDRGNRKVLIKRIEKLEDKL